jgi:hypothetical protein
VLYHHAIKLTNLPRHLTPEVIEELFRPYGKLADVRCPKPLQVKTCSAVGVVVGVVIVFLLCVVGYIQIFNLRLMTSYF